MVAGGKSRTTKTTTNVKGNLNVHARRATTIPTIRRRESHVEEKTEKPTQSTPMADSITDSSKLNS